jgi:two-component system osmolarity sensor histidine kinase EnvZ
MTLAPRSLRVRAFLLIALLIMLSLAASTLIYRQAEQEPRAHQTAQMVISVVNLTRAALLAADPTLRSALLAEMAGAEGIRVFPAEGNDMLVAFPSENTSAQLMVAEIRRALGAATHLAASRNDMEGFWVSFLIGDDAFWVMMPRERVERPRAWQWLGWVSLVLLLALIGGALIARQVGKPLRDMAKAARAIGQGETPPPLDESGAEETMIVARAFNQMSADLASIERERSLVLAGISHDLRTPLTRLRIAAEFIADQSSRDGLIADVEQMDVVVGQFLDYARLGEQEPVSATDLKALAESVALPYAKRAKQLNLELAELPLCQVRPLLLKRALANLLDNAIKYGEGDIVLRLHEQMWHGRPCAFLAVLDRGPGIPPESVEAVKRPFVRLDNARGGVGGSGLGLAIVERAARLHGGEFHLELRNGGGLKATLMLPLAS